VRQNYISVQLFASGLTKFFGWLEIASGPRIETPFTQDCFISQEFGRFETTHERFPSSRGPVMIVKMLFYRIFAVIINQIATVTHSNSKSH
jgi:hypothetical protein